MKNYQKSSYTQQEIKNDAI